MSRDAKQSLILVGAVLLLFGGLWLAMTFAPDIPDWVEPSAMALLGLGLVWQLVRWAWSKAATRRDAPR